MRGEMEMYTHKVVKTLAIEELLSLFRDYGIPCSQESVAALIESGKLPFAICTEKEPGRRRKYLIFARGAVEWLEAHAEE